MTAPGATRTPLDAAEQADAAVSAALVVTLLAVGRLIAAGTFFQVLATIVIAVLAARRRTRAVVASTVAAASLAVLLGGIGPVTQAALSGMFGWAAGTGLRRELGLVRHVGLTVMVCWPVVAGLTVALLAVFAEFRDLTLRNIGNQWDGFAEILERAGLGSVAEIGTDAVAWAIDNWWLFVPAVQLLVTVGYALIIRRLGRAVLRRVDSSLGPPWTPPPVVSGPTTPLPLTLAAPVVNRGARRVDLGHVRAEIEPGRAAVLVGLNGSGKTSLLEAIAGLAPAAGIHPVSSALLGRVGGTALVGQRPETTVVGHRVVDDVRWGLRTADVTVIAALLETVGLGDKVEASTATLSGGELQRLAIASALARRPALLLSDESTSMLDPASRARVLDLLHAAVNGGTALLHTTHLDDELTAFDTVIAVGSIAPGAVPGAAPHPPPAFIPPILEARNVGHVHDADTPWARPVFSDISFAVRPAELALVVGSNGSGKTTLARVLAGLSNPTSGTVVLGGEPLTRPSRHIGIAFQHPRLQLVESRVAREVAALAGVTDPDQVTDALAVMGLEPSLFASRRVDELSGGEQRRVLLAGLLARDCRVVVLDEPLAGLDGAGRALLGQSIRHLLDRGVAVVMVAHDPDWLPDWAGTIVDLDRHSARAVAT